MWVQTYNWAAFMAVDMFYLVAGDERGVEYG